MSCDHYYALLPQGPDADIIRDICGTYIGMAEQMHSALAALQIAGVKGHLLAIVAAAVLPDAKRRELRIREAARYADRYDTTEVDRVRSYGWMVMRLQALADERGEVAA